MELIVEVKIGDIIKKNIVDGGNITLVFQDSRREDMRVLQLFECNMVWDVQVNPYNGEQDIVFDSGYCGEWYGIFAANGKTGGPFSRGLVWSGKTLNNALREFQSHLADNKQANWKEIPNGLGIPMDACSPNGAKMLCPGEEWFRWNDISGNYVPESDSWEEYLKDKAGS